MKKVVYPHFTFDSTPTALIFGMDKMLFASLSSYFMNGNDTPVVVMTNSFRTQYKVYAVAKAKGWNVEVELVTTTDVNACESCKMIDNFRYNTTAPKVFTLINAAKGDDILLCDCDTIWCDKIDWSQPCFNNEMCVFQPRQWQHDASVGIGDMFYWNAVQNKQPFETFMHDLLDESKHWRHFSLYDKWINGGHIYMTSHYRTVEFPKSIENCTRKIVTSCEEIYLENALLARGNNDFSPSIGTDISDYGLNTPIPFMNLTWEDNPFKPLGVVSMHYFAKPKPWTFSITYTEKIEQGYNENAWHIDYYDTRLNDMMFNSVNGRLATYVWYYYFMDAARLYVDGNTTPVYPPASIKRVIDGYLRSRGNWVRCSNAVAKFEERGN